MDTRDIPHWVVGGKHIYNQLEAWEEIARSKREFRYYFYEHVYDRFDWSVEPKQTWDELVHQRCLQLRQKYRKLSLWYSGGRDSHHILRSFIKHNIPIDELLLLHWTMNPIRSAEYYDWQIPLANKYKEINPGVKITTVDIGSKEYERYYSWMTPDKKYFVDDGLFQPSDFEWFTVNLCNISDSSTGVITGLEKPYIYLSNGKIYHRFVDKLIEEYRGSIEEFEMFYYAPSMPELYIKQCHILANYIKRKYPNRSRDFIHQFTKNSGTGEGGNYYSEFCTACGRGPAIDGRSIIDNGKSKYDGSHTLFDGLIDLAKKENFQSLKVWEDYSSHWTNKTPQAFQKDYRNGVTGILSNPKYITDYV